MVIDGYTGKMLFAENANKPRFPASVTKVMTLYLLFEQLRKAGHDSSTPSSRSAPRRLRTPPVETRAGAGSDDLVHDAMYALVTKSANDVAAVIAENVAGSETAFARMMTHESALLGMTNTTFRNASGLPDPGQMTTARDLVTLGRQILADFPEESKIFRTRYFQYGDARFKNHNGCCSAMPGMEGLKTGYHARFRLQSPDLVPAARTSICRRRARRQSSRQRNSRMRELLDQSWGKAIAFNEHETEGRGQRRRDCRRVLADMMPERNPAFHAGEAEEQLRIAMAEARKNDEAKGREVASPGLALASLTAQAQAPTEDNNEDAAETDEAPAADPVEAKAETVVSDATALGPYHVQVGSFLDVVSAKQRLTIVAGKAKKLVNGHGELTVPGEVGGKNYFRARFGQFTREDAAAACSKLKRLSFECLVVRVE